MKFTSTSIIKSLKLLQKHMTIYLVWTKPCIKTHDAELAKTLLSVSIILLFFFHNFAHICIWLLLFLVVSPFYWYLLSLFVSSCKLTCPCIHIVNISYQGGIPFSLNVVSFVNDGLKRHTKLNKSHMFLLSSTQIIPKSTQMYTLYTNLSFYTTFIMFHYIRQ